MLPESGPAAASTLRLRGGLEVRLDLLTLTRVEYYLDRGRSYVIYGLARGYTRLVDHNSIPDPRGTLS